MNSQHVPQTDSQAVLVRDQSTCQACGMNVADLEPGESMRGGFIVRNGPHAFTDVADLTTLCPDCDEGFATATLPPHMNAPQLLRELRRVSVVDQLAVLDWLKKKYRSRGSK